MAKIDKESIVIFLLALLIPTSAFADGGIPIWVNTIQTVAATSGIRGLGSPIAGFIITLIFLALVILVETWFLKKRYFKATNTKKLIEVVSVSNLVSTVLGGLLLWCVFYSVVFTSDSYSIGYLILGPFYKLYDTVPNQSLQETVAYYSTISTAVFFSNIIFYNLFFCIFSYFIELYITKHYLKDVYDKKVISKGILRANILSYALSFFLMLPIYFLLYGIVQLSLELIFLLL